VSESFSTRSSDAIKGTFAGRADTHAERFS
jgi:hypothetical protein